MTRGSLIPAAALLISAHASAERLWLVVAASAATPAAIAAKAAAMASQWPQGLVVSTADCGESKRVFAFAAGVESSRDAAQALLEKSRITVKDAYLKPCETVSGSLASLRVHAVDPSIADVPADAVNWDDRDRVSDARPLPGGRALVAVRQYVAEKGDPLEGRRVRVLLANGATKSRALVPNCVGIENIVSAPDKVAFDCVNEEAGDQLLHATYVFSDAGSKLAELSRCRQPRFDGATSIVCQKETVDANGKLTLTAVKTRLPE